MPTVREARIRSEYDLTVIGLRHGSNVAVDDLLDERLKLGDTLLLIGFWSDIRELQSDMDDVVVLNMPAELTEVLPAARPEGRLFKFHECSMACSAATMRWFRQLCSALRLSSY
jgi:di/tricarboxylate transporter